MELPMSKLPAGAGNVAVDGVGAYEDAAGYTGPPSICVQLPVDASV